MLIQRFVLNGGGASIRMRKIVARGFYRRLIETPQSPRLYGRDLGYRLAVYTHNRELGGGKAKKKKKGRSLYKPNLPKATCSLIQN